jgi:signal peptidase I
MSKPTNKPDPVASPRPEVAASPSTGSAAASKGSPAPASTASAFRETVESVVIAFILAFLFRTFAAEAFVIPTGSMAPTLQGRHKWVECPQCHVDYRVSASDEQSETMDGPKRLVQVYCPQCRAGVNVDPQSKECSQTTSYSGDRIIVGKFAYEVNEPQRWDVFVFHYPGDAKVNYIKRLVGLPDETLRIDAGDIFVKKHGQGEFRRELRSHEKLHAMLQSVYDNDYQSGALNEANWPARWQPQTPGGETWQANDGNRQFEVAAGEQTAWLRYQHFLPPFEGWSKSKFLPPATPEPSLITDLYAYNTFETDPPRSTDRHRQGNWVGDLAVEADVDSKSESGEVVFELVKGGLRSTCTLNLATGSAELAVDGRANFHPVSTTRIKGIGKHQIRWANCDNCLYLWVDGTPVNFDQATSYDDGTINDDQPVLVPLAKVKAGGPASDLSPIGIGVRSGKVAVNHLRLFRDVYYISAKVSNGQMLRDEGRYVDFDIGEDQFFALGDNSPQSKDGRLWENGHTVDRNLIIGKAVFIYWPSTRFALPVPGTGIDVPFWPNWSSMKFVR